MDVTNVLRMLNFNPELTQRINDAANRVLPEVAEIRTKGDAINVLQRHGIGTDVIGKVKSYANHPLASIAAKAMGVNLTQIKSDLAELTNESAPTTGHISNGSIDKFRSGLNQLR